MISEDFAFDQVDRLCGLRFFPGKVRGVLELVKALQKLAPTESEAERIVSEWIEENREAPTPADFYAMRRTMRRVTSEGNDPYAEFIPEWKKGPQAC